MKNLVIHLDAEDEMNAAASYYDAQEIGLGLDFLDEIHFAFNKIKKFPV